MMNGEEYNHFLNGLTPVEIAEYLKDIFPEFGDLDVEEVLLQQESAFLHIQNNRQHDVEFDYGEPSNRSVFFAPQIQSSHGETTESQLALDEALARALELGDDFNGLHISEPGGSTFDNTGSTLRETPTTGAGQNTRQDDIDPDRMTYEELQSLGESVGDESKGLPVDLISRLPTFKYKAGFLSKKKKKEKEECVICCAEYKKGAELITLPCAHHYHSDCIIHWLQLKKHCPVCQKEVRDE
ncbi:hypothetical protein Pfo_014852 [Paulownia fortunei]|nr:hypothetical protein Pfo_014852 [Paulownia fortunei]